MARHRLALPAFKSKQQLIFNSEWTEALLGGDTRSGKSFFVRKALILWCSQIPGLQTDIFRLHYDDVISENMLGETSFPELLSDLVQADLVKITENEIKFWNDSRISLEHCNDDVTMMKHQGIAKHVRVFSESCQLLERRIRALTGWVTMSQEMRDRVPEKWKGQFPKVIHATNPLGPSAGYYIRSFVDARPPYQVEQVGMHKRVYFPMFLTDNDSEDAQQTIARIKEAFPDESTQKALLECDWHQRTGEFFPEWDESRHVIEDLIPPAHWFRFRGLDLGYAEPCCVYWVAVSDGEPFYDQNRRERWYPRGAFIIYKEWYICDQRDPSKGLRFRNEDIRDGIIERTEYGHRQDPTLTDSLPFQDRGGESVPAVFADKGNGIILTKGDTSRVNGWNQLRSRLIGIKHPSLIDKFGVPLRVPMIYLVESCKYGRDYMPMLQRHPADKKREDAQEHGEATHACFIAGTLINTANGPVKIEKLLKNDKVIAGDGASRPISAAGVTKFETRVITLTFNNGDRVTCTPDHQFLTENGWEKAVDTIGLVCIMGACPKSLMHLPKNSTGEFTNSIQAKDIFLAHTSGFIEKCGNFIMARSQKAFTSITKIIIQPIIQLKIWKSLVLKCTDRFILVNRKREKRPNLIYTKPLRLHQNGISQNRGGSGIKKIIQGVVQFCTQGCKNIARNVEMLLVGHLTPVTAFVHPIASRDFIGKLDEKSESVHIAKGNSTVLSSQQQKHAQEAALLKQHGKSGLRCQKIQEAGFANVYCLTEPVTHSFQLANNLIVSNCDTLRIICMAHTVIKDKVVAMESRIAKALAKKPTIKGLLSGTPQADIFKAFR